MAHESVPQETGGVLSECVPFGVNINEGGTSVDDEGVSVDVVANTNELKGCQNMHEDVSRAAVKMTEASCTKHEFLSATCSKMTVQHPKHKSKLALHRPAKLVLQNV